MTSTTDNAAATSEETQRQDIEPLRDHNIKSSSQAYDDFDGHRYHMRTLGVHLPRGPRHIKRQSLVNLPASSSGDQKGLTSTDGEAVQLPLGGTKETPAERVQFILGQDSGIDGEDEHAPHELFCELEELLGDGDRVEWKETARWVKFEEDVEAGGNRWSKPHVATLSLHSMFELRSCLMYGTVMLDMNAQNFVEIIDLLLEGMVNRHQLNAEQKEQVRTALTRRHRHQYEKRAPDEAADGLGSNGNGNGFTSLPVIRSLAEIGRKSSSGKKLSTTTPAMCPDVPPIPENAIAPPVMLERPEIAITEAEPDDAAAHLRPLLPAANPSAVGLMLPILQQTPSDSKLSAVPSDTELAKKGNLHFLKKIPVGAEASNILVGEVDFLEKPIIAFVRLQKGVVLGNLTEVPIPTRFLFFLLGPKEKPKKYHEIGRSIATLMSDEVFHSVAYRARSREDLLYGIDEFLDQVIVLPPGEWDPAIRIEPPSSVPNQGDRLKPPVPAGEAAGGSGGDGEGKGSWKEHAAEHEDPDLVRTGHIFGGLRNDLRNKLPHYFSDYRDCLSVQCIASFVFMYFACLAPIVTFGGLLGDATGNYMAAFESILSGFVSGVTWHLFSGQPLTIIGSTGPVLVFEQIVFDFCKSHGFNYLSFRFWIGMWIAFFLLLVVAFDYSALVRYITRFTEEGFATLIAVIFIYEAFNKLSQIATAYPTTADRYWWVDLNCTCLPKPTTTTASVLNTSTVEPMFSWANATESRCWSADIAECKSLSECTLTGNYCRLFPDVFFLCWLLFFGTFATAYALKKFKTSSFLPNKVRSTVSDFAVFLAIVIWVGIDRILHFDTPKLMVPKQFTPTNPLRSFVVNPFLNPIWTYFFAGLFALLATILIFLDQQITSVIINRKEHKLMKGKGYHLDMLVITVLVAVNSLLGLPWFVAATVLSINHVASLRLESETSAPGDKPVFFGVREQRVTGLLVFVLIGLSVFMTNLLSLVPMAVLYGVFLYMGISSMNGLQFFDRLIIMLMPMKYQPDLMYLRHVRILRVHLFTAIQLLCFVILWVMKTIKSVSITFPLMVLAMVLVRFLLNRIFTQEELFWLDDIMPEAHKREKAEKKAKEEEEEERERHASGYQLPSSGNLQIPLEGGKVMNIPVRGLTYRPETHTVNLSEEMAQTAIWKQIAANQRNPDIRSVDFARPSTGSPGDDGKVVRWHLNADPANTV